MNKVFGVLSLLMVFGGSAQAGAFSPDYVCTSDNGEVLTIDLLQTRTETIIVRALLKEDNLTQKLTGNTKQGLTVYHMDDLNGEKVSLAVKTVFDHGGRCGRCAPSIDTETYAKLTIGLEEKTFSCN